MLGNKRSYSLYTGETIRAPHKYKENTSAALRVVSCTVASNSSTEH